MANVLLIDDDELIHEHLTEELEERGHTVRSLHEADEGLDLLARTRDIELVLLDNRMPRMSGMEFLEQIRVRELESPPVILMTGEHTDSTAISATNKGAFSYVIKPVDLDGFLDELEPEIIDALKVNRRRQPVSLSPSLDDFEDDDSTMVGRSKPMLKVLSLIGRFADMDETVLIQGETGTGKDLVVRALHTNSRRGDKRYVALNCAALNENLLDDELFGHEVGAFTGATKVRKGRFEHAEGGVVFLDEVGDMPLTLQAKLLRTLENREVTRLGSNDPIKVDVRVVAATHRDLDQRVAEGHFREDLLNRLRRLVITLPPLRERSTDVPLLANRFLARSLGGSKSAPQLHPGTLEALCAFDWPGNVRQLQNVLCRALGTCRGPIILPEDLDFGDQSVVKPRSETEEITETEAIQGMQKAIQWVWKHQSENLSPVLEELLERELLVFAAAQAKVSGISQNKLADLLGMAKNTLVSKLKKHQLSLKGS